MLERCLNSNGFSSQCVPGLFLGWGEGPGDEARDSSAGSVSVVSFEVFAYCNVLRLK